MLKFFYDKEIGDIEYAFIQGIRYAIANDIGSINPNDEAQFSEYHKNKDFAFLFDFGDNDFGLHFEKAAKLYCDAYNELLGTIDMYSKYDASDYYIKKFEHLESVDIIKEILKLGVASHSLERDVDGHHIDNINFENSKNDIIRTIDEYLPFTRDKKKWDKNEDGEYIENGVMPRLVVGTVCEIEKALEDYGTPYKGEEVPERDFPVWCNGEVIIVYMKNGYLTYLNR